MPGFSSTLVPCAGDAGPSGQIQVLIFWLERFKLQALLVQGRGELTTLRTPRGASGGQPRERVGQYRAGGQAACGGFWTGEKRGFGEWSTWVADGYLGCGRFDGLLHAKEGPAERQARGEGVQGLGRGGGVGN